MTEKDITGYEGIYTIDTDGVVRNNRKTATRGAVIKPHQHKSGYWCISLTNGEGNRKTLKVHRLLAAEFLPNPDGFDFINHINGDKSDSRIENLEWCSHSHNIKHAYDTGLIKRGRKIEEREASFIKDLMGAGMSNKMIAALFSLSPSFVSNIRTGRKWASA